MKEPIQISDSKYVLISACRNEGANILALMEMIYQQTIKPFLWVIVDDGSTDDTYLKLEYGSKKYEYLYAVKFPLGRKRSFASKVYALQYGYELVRERKFDFVGFLDADISFSKEYYELMMKRMNDDFQIGLIGGKVLDIYDEKSIDTRSGSENYHVAGGVQFFRRICFDSIGGYKAIDVGGEDTVADIMTMMRGWKVKTISEVNCRHLRPQGSVYMSEIKRGILWGKRFYSLGYHPIYYLGQCFFQVKRRSILTGVFWQFIGFILAELKGGPRAVDDDFIRYLRKFQLRRIRCLYKPN